MSESLKELLKQRDGHIPTVLHYEELLYAITNKLDISYETARKRYGQYTYTQWAKIIKF